MKLKVLAAVVALNVAAISGAIALDPELPGYETATGVSGQIKSVGSDTLASLMELWAKDFKSRYPDVTIDVQGKGSATAPSALLEGTSQFGPMSRPMTMDELNAFEKKFGYKVSGFRVAVDALAVYVNKDNPIECLTVQQVNRIFSTSRRAAFGGDIATWGDASLTGAWATARISLYGRNALSGTFEFFKEMALYGGEYKQEINQQPGSEAVVQSVASDRFAIGYSGIGYRTDGVRAVPLAVSSGETCYDTSAESAYSGKYPLARYLYIYLNKDPGRPLEPLRAEFIKYILSKDGQAQTEKGGFYPITSQIRREEMKKLGIVASQ